MTGTYLSLAENFFTGPSGGTPFKMAEFNQISTYK